MSYKSLVQVIKEHNTPVELLEIQQKEVDLDEDFMTLFLALWGTGAMLVLPALMIYDVANRNSNYKLDAKVGEIVGKLLSKFKKNKNYKPNSAEIDASKKLEKEVKSKEPSIFNKAMSKLKSIKSIKEHNAGLDLEEAKGLSIYGSEVSGLKRTDNGKGRSTLQYSSMSTYTAKPVVLKGKLAFRVEDTMGGFETLDLLSFAKMYG